MSNHKEENYLIDVYEKIQRVKEKMDQVSFEDFKQNQDLQEIIEYNLMIIGEAISKVSTETLLKLHSDSMYWR